MEPQLRLCTNSSNNFRTDLQCAPTTQRFIIQYIHHCMLQCCTLPWLASCNLSRLQHKTAHLLLVHFASLHCNSCCSLLCMLCASQYPDCMQPLQLEFFQLSHCSCLCSLQATHCAQPTYSWLHNPTTSAGCSCSYSLQNYATGQQIVQVHLLHSSLLSAFQILVFKW